MPRQIITKELTAMPQIQAVAKPDQWTDKVVKLIPANVVAVYLGVFNLIKSQSAAQNQSSVLQWVVFGLVAIITPFYLKKTGIVQTKQIILCQVSFLFGYFLWEGHWTDIDGSIYSTIFRRYPSTHLYFSNSVIL